MVFVGRTVADTRPRPEPQPRSLVKKMVAYPPTIDIERSGHQIDQLLRKNQMAKVWGVPVGYSYAFRYWEVLSG